MLLRKRPELKMKDARLRKLLVLRKKKDARPRKRLALRKKHVLRKRV